MELIVIGAFAMIIALITLCTVWLFRFHHRYLVLTDDSDLAGPGEAQSNVPVNRHIFRSEDDRGKELNLTTGFGDDQTPSGGEKQPLPEEVASFVLTATVDNAGLPDQALPEERRTPVAGGMAEGESRFETRPTVVAVDLSDVAANVTADLADLAAEEPQQPAGELVGMGVTATPPETGWRGELEAFADGKKKTSRE